MHTKIAATAIRIDRLRCGNLSESLIAIRLPPIAILRLRSQRLRSLPVTPMLSTAMVHGLHLLQLVWCQNRGQLLIGALLDRVHLLAEVLRWLLTIAAQCRQLLVAIRKDRRQLRSLVRRQVQLFAKVFGLALRVGGMAVVEVLLALWLRCRWVLRNSNATGNGKDQGCGD